MNNQRLELVADFYEYTMANGYFNKNMEDRIAYFDVFFRKVPDEGGYAIVAGLEQIINYIRNLSFDEEDISYLRKQNKFSEEFLNYLENFRFTGDIWAIPEGTVVFPNEPLITVKAPIIQAQLLETMLLLTTNHQSLIATKTSRIVKEAQGRPVMEFGARRAHGINAAVEGARAAIIGGAVGTSCTLSAKEFNIPASGTMAHSWIQSFDSEYEAFKAYAELYPDDCTFLIDTYNTIESGLPNAIKVFNEVLKPKGYRPKAVRLDSGDLAYLSKKVRKILDEAGYEDCKICATNSLDEYLIKSLIEQDAKIDLFGVGEKDKKIVPKIKVSENTAKVTNPSFKKVYRFYDNETKKAIADVITLADEILDEREYMIFDPQNPWKKKILKDYSIRLLQEKIFEERKINL